MAAAEARKKFAEYMSGSASNNNSNAQQQAQQQGANLQNPYIGFGGQQLPQGMQNPYAGQQFPPFNPVSIAAYYPSPSPSTYPRDMSELSTALVPIRALSTDRQQFAHAQVPPAAPTPPPAVPPVRAPNSHGALAQAGQQLQPYAPPGPPAYPQPRPPGYVELPRTYNQSQQPPHSSYNPAWSYNQPGPHHNYVDASAHTMPPTYHPRDWTYEESNDTRETNRFRYTGAYPPPDVVRFPTPPPPATVNPPPDVPPLALCHVCSMCGRMRSTSYHRSHPIIPGQALVSTPCGYCKKKVKKEKAKREKEKAKREEAKDRSKRTITIEIDDGDASDRDRGRARAREDVYEVHRRSSSSPRHTVYRAVSRARNRRGDYTAVEYRAMRELSPERSPPPVLKRRTRSEVRISSSSPRRDGVRIHYRRDEEDERRRSPSPDARARLAAHPAPFRTVEPVFPGQFPEDPIPTPRGILKPGPQWYARPTHTLEVSNESMIPEVGGNHVQFVRESRDAEHAGEYYTQRVRCEGNECTCDDEYLYRHCRSHRFPRGQIEELSPSPELPVQKLERLRVRDDSSPHHRVEYRHVVVEPVRNANEKRERVAVDDRRRTHYSRTEYVRSPSPVREAIPRAKEIVQGIQRSLSYSPPLKRKQPAYDEITDSGSEDDNDRVYYVRVKGVDENGRSAEFIEKRIRKPSPPRAREPLEGPALSYGFAPADRC